MKIKIDGKELNVSNADKNIVEVAAEHGIKILAPCFNAEKRNGCCSACVIEIDGEEKYACGTKPMDGMNIIYDREDLSAKRQERLETYAKNLKEGKENDCSCGESCCGGSCDCSNGCC